MILSVHGLQLNKMFTVALLVDGDLALSITMIEDVAGLDEIVLTEPFQIMLDGSEATVAKVELTASFTK